MTLKCTAVLSAQFTMWIKCSRCSRDRRRISASEASEKKANLPILMSRHGRDKRRRRARQTGEINERGKSAWELAPVHRRRTRRRSLRSARDSGETRKERRDKTRRKSELETSTKGERGRVAEPITGKLQRERVPTGKGKRKKREGGGREGEKFRPRCVKFRRVARNERVTRHTLKALLGGLSTRGKQ